jgi:hypothetical protein
LPATPLSPTAASKPRRWGWLLAGVGASALACLACVCLAGVGVLVFNFMPASRQVTASTPVVVVRMETSLPLELTPAATATPAPTAAAITPTAAPAPTDAPDAEQTLAAQGIYDDGGVRFIYDLSLASAITVEEVAANAGDNVPPWDIFPRHFKIFLQDYPAKRSMHTAQIIIYPVEEYRELFPEVENPIFNLAQLLEMRPELLSDDQALPFLPFWNAGQMIHARAGYIDNETLSGICYLTQYGQDVAPVSSDRLFYTIQGLSRDGKYYIAAVMPVAHFKLPDSSQFSAEAYQGLAEDYQAYLAETRRLLDELPADSFKPGLGLLDALFETLEVGENR